MKAVPGERKRLNISEIIQLVFSLFLFFIPASSSAQDFTAKTIGDYGNVTVMEVTGNYDADNPDGSVNSAPREAIAKEFFRTHKDEYDFVVIFSNFDFKMPESEVRAFYLGIKNDVQGIGSPLVDNSALFGSNGKLQGTIDMGNVLTHAVDPTDPNFEDPLDTLSHEVMHRWAAYVKYKDSSGNISTALLGSGAAHWSFLLDSYASLMYGNQWKDNGDGTFTSINARKYYSPLDLYLMGFNDKSQVPPMLLIANPAIDPARMPEVGATITGTPGYVSIDDIIAAEGERIPGPADSQKTFKTAFIFITTPGTFTGDELSGIENIRNGWVTRFSALTGGKGIMQVVPTVREDVPVNPGPALPPVTPRTLPPNVNDGVKWLMTNQRGDGSWMDLSQTTDRDTATVVLALKNFPAAQQNYSLGFQWLNSENSVNIDYLSRKIAALANSGQDLSAFIGLLVSEQNGDGGWGSNNTYMSNPTDTSLALGALSLAGYSNQTVISAAIAYLNSTQNIDGGWGDDEGSTIGATANVLTAFSVYRSSYQLETQITNGIAWLTQRQNPDGGFGNSPSTVYDSALAVLALRAFNVSIDITNNGLNYILSQQSGSGSWNESPYQTALAINAVWKATVDPDLSVKPDDITFIPPSVSVVPSNIAMNVTMWNLGMTDVPQAKVALYDGSISDANKIGQQVVAFPGQSSVTITFSITITDGNEHTYYIVIDPDNLIQESNKSNNIAAKVLNPQGTYDFQVLSSDISASPNPANIFNNVTITSKVSNNGTLNAYNVQIQYYIDDPKGPFDIATSTVDIPAGAAVTNQIIWHANKAGDNLPLTVLVDPFNTFTELSKTNNKASISLTVRGSTDPNLTVSYKDIVITPSPANAGGNANISVLVKNEGFSAASNITVNFYKGTPGVDGVLLGSQVIASLNAGDSSTVSVNWTNIMDSGERIIYVLVDPNNLITEISKDDNSAFVTLKILSLPDLAISTNSIVFSPSAPKDGDTVAITVTVQNQGDQSASNVTVRASEGGTVIGSQVIPSVAGNSQANALFTYDTKGKPGAHQITVVVDPDNAITEQSKDNNTASRTFGVQNAKLWVTEPYISPNGDGVKDSTQFFFSFDVPETVTIVVNGKNGAVRTFNGSNLANVTSGNVTWDGLDDNGMVVNDGPYQLQVVNATGVILGSLVVTVDNNRSPLPDAIGTKYLLNTNLSCMLPYIDSWQWFPDESGILFSINTPNQNTPGYPTGLYTMSPDGEDILRIVPQAWCQGADPQYDYYFKNYVMSPDGSKVAFILDKRDKTLPQWLPNIDSTQFWVVNSDGTNLTLLDLGNPTLSAWSMVWSTTSQYIAFMESGNSTQLRIIKPDGTGNALIDPDGDYIDTSTVMSWSPDGTRIAYISYALDAQGNSAPKVRIADTLGNLQDIYTMSSYGGYFTWFGNAALFLSSAGQPQTFWLIDASGAGNNKEVSEFDGKLLVAPNGKSVAFTTTASYESNVTLSVADASGNATVLYTLTAGNSQEALLNIVDWSPDSSNIAFLEYIRTNGDPGRLISGPFLSIMNIATATKTSYQVDPTLQLYKWLSDGISIVGTYNDSNGGVHIAAINATTGAIASLFSDVNAAIPGSVTQFISPFQRYLAYFDMVDPSSLCYASGGYDLWAISSLLNLTADLRIVKEKSDVLLKGIAADLNFDSYALEYADINNPTTWNPISPPSDVPVLNDVFTTWVPPYEGVFYVRLTVWDKAGNVATSLKRVTWGLSSSITNLYTNYDIFSPNGDGVKDTVELHYTVLEPVHLEFNIYDENGNIVRSIEKDYTSPIIDYIVWDGRDDSGKIVPDGKYTIKVFDYQYIAELDNTPPDVGIHIGLLMQDLDPLSGNEGELYTEITGHSIDKNLKSWVIESGEGDNPQEWYKIAEGQDILGNKDEKGNAQDASIEEYAVNKIKLSDAYVVIKNDIEGLVNKKVRITAEDFAGNKSTTVTDFLEERMVLYRFHDQPFLYMQLGRYPAGDFATLSIGLYSYEIKPALHLGGIETIRSAIASMNVQYSEDGNGWVDAPPVMNPPPGEIDLQWDTSGLGMKKVSAIRVRAVDVNGQEHYSNEVDVIENFNIDLCTDSAMNSLYEDLKLLKFEVQSNQDTRYTHWTDYKVFDSSKGDIIPVGEFGMLFPDIKPGMTYSFRMIGIGVSGKYYESETLTYPPNNCPGGGGGGGGGGNPPPGDIKMELLVHYHEADCNQISDGKVLLWAPIPGLPNIWLKTLTYYLQHPDGLQLLRQIDLSKEGWGDVTVDTSNLPEGSYPVKAVLTYRDTSDTTTKELTAGNILVVDRVPPVAQITYPGKNSMVCRVPQGSFYAVPVEGTAMDNRLVFQRYEMFYVSADNPTTWAQAMTRLGLNDFPILVNAPKQGELGLWDVTDLKGNPFSLKLKVVDIVGNVSCDVVSFSIDYVIDIANLSTDKTLFSPNGDGLFDDVQVSYEIDKDAKVDVKVFPLTLNPDGTYTLGSTPLRTIVSGLQHASGTENTVWDGKYDSGAVVPDGLYAIWVFATDSCGNTTQKWTKVEVDNTPPTVAITYPKPGDPLGNIVEIRGTADDLHFKSYTLEAGKGDNPDTWTLIVSYTNSVKDDILGIWDTFGLSDRWTLRLTAVDAVANKNVITDTIDLGQRKTLIKDLNAVPRLFSPNNDGILDTTTITYGLTDSCQIEIDILDSSGAVRRTYTAAAPSSGTYTFVWDGTDNAGARVSDGPYTVKLHAALSSSPSVTEDESVTVVVDVTPPTIDLTQPLNNSFFQGDVVVSGTINDTNLQAYSMNYTGDSGTVLFGQGNQNRVSYLFGTISGLAEGNYALNASASDLAGNTTQRIIAFTIDKTPPQVTLNTPKEGDLYGSNNGTIAITGSIVEKNLDSFSLRYGLGNNPSQWTELLSGNTIPATSQLSSWSVGKSAGVPDGLYTLSLYAKDKAGLTGEARVHVTIDNNPPDVAITFPQDGAYIRGPSDIKGTATDANFAQYTLELSEGQCAVAFKWAVIKTSTVPVKDGTLASLQVLPSDGNYCLRLTATDKAGNTSQAKSGFIIDTHPPATPVLSGTIDNKTNARLTWTQDTEPDLAGYNLYRDAQKVNSAILKDITYLDQNLKEAVYAYTVTALDLAGNESSPSNQVKLKVDITPPDAKISVPKDGSRVGGLVDIKGTAYSADDFKQYRVSIGLGASPSSWNIIRTSPVPIPYGSLAQWDTTTLPEVLYSIKLEAEDLSGNINTRQITVTVDNTPPAAPVLLSAVPSGSNVTLTWKANTEPDLAGYLLYRNDQLANVNGIVVGDLTPYLLVGTTYLDKALPDGKFKYYLIAMDQAGNLSNQSNSIAVTIDTHPPHMTIVDPKDGTKFQNRIPVTATSPDLDIASVQFQYKRVQDSLWINLGAPVTQSPYTAYLDPTALGLTYGDYNLRAVATDQGGKADPSPSYITVTYTDLTAPNAPTGLKALTNGAAVTLTWTSNTESDLAGYNVYRASSGGSMSMVNTSLVNVATYQDKGLQDGTYAYTVTAVDTFGNESTPSSSALAKVYAPVISQPYTPTGQQTLQIKGGNAAASSSVEVFVDAGSGPVSQGKASSDASGNFVFNASLTLGENRITAKATDSAGNISRASDMVVVVYDVPPAAPTGLALSVNGYDVSLTWNPNTESNLSGYNLFRNGTKLNAPSAVTDGTITASASFSPPANAFDSDPTTYWGAYDNDPANPSWWEIDLPSAELISHMEIHWGSETDAQGNETLYAGKDYEVQVWSGYAWITQEQVTGNTAKDSIFDFVPSYRTDKVRIYITDTTDPNTSSKQVRISEVNLRKDNLITATSYTDSSLHDGTYSYKLTAVDYYGFESLPSDEAKTPVGDVTPPAAPQNLTATASGSNVNLSWTPNTEADLAGYNVYRNTPQGWIMINPSLITDAAFIDMNLPNGTYTYRVTAVDAAGNESMPSNEASANISIALLQPPINLKVTSVPGGGALGISWEYTGSAAGYNLYRSTTKGGPYTKVNGSLLSSNSYLDTGLTNGAAYYYVVTAVDTAGNESAYSNEATGIPSDTVPPAAPVIFFPTVPGRPVINYSGKTDVLGSAEPASTVELFENGASAGKTSASGNDTFQGLAMSNASNDVSVSPDEKSLAYAYNGSIWLEDLTTSGITKIVPQGNSPLWSPAGSSLSYMVGDNSGNNHIYIYNAQAGNSQALTGDTAFSEDSPSWSADGNKIAFLSNRGGSYDVWVKDMVSGSLTQLTSGVNPSCPKLSPDVNKLDYFVNQTLYVLDLGSNTATLVDNNTDGCSSDWSPDGNALAFISYRSSPGDIYTFEASTQNQIQITDLATSGLSLPIWAADGGQIVFDKWDAARQKDTLEVVPAIEHGQNRIVKDGLQLSYLARTALGGIAFTDQNTVNIAHFKGLFSFSALGLYPGENLFHATATDAPGNVSQPSDDISVVFDTGQLPDLAITPDDIVIYPLFPIVGQTAVITATVRNVGQADASSVAVDLYLQDPQGNLKLLQSTTIPSISAGADASVSLALDTTGNAGTNEIIVVVDPLDQINELTKTNNTAEKELFVAQQEGVVMTTTLDSGQYQSSQNVNIVIDLKNSGSERDGTVETRVEDQTGQIVAPIDTTAIQLPYASEQSYALLWNTGSTYAGSYNVHTIFKDAAANIIAENIVAFTILPDMNIDVSLVTDKTAYGSNEDVTLAISVKNNGQNFILPELDVKVKVLDASSNVLFNDTKTIVNLLPGATDNINSTWNTALSPAGSYSAAVEVYYNSQLISSKSAAFTVNASSIIGGNVSVTPTVVLAGSNAQVGYVVQNIGNAVMNGVVLNLLIIDPDTQTIMNTHADTADLGINATKSGGFTLSTQGYALKTYTVALQYVYQGNTKTIATASFTVRDGTPPVVNIISPVSGNTYNAKFDITVIATDDASGVGKVEYQMDGGTWKLLPVSDPSSGRYSTSWTPSAADGGSHTISARATDNAGNTSAAVSVAITINVSVSPPTGTITINNNAAYTNAADVSLTLSAVDSSGGAAAKMCISNSASCTSWEAYAGTKAWTLSSGDGLKTVYVWYQDNLGNSDSVPYSASITLDTTAPLLTVSALPDGSWTNNNLLNVSGTATDDTGIRQVTINGTVVTLNPDGSFSYPVTLQDGPNTVTVIATDLAGNQATDTRTINLDQDAPVITIATPADNIVTKQSPIDVTGSVDDQSTVTVSVNGAVPVAAVMNGTDFSLSVTPGYGINTIEVTATDLAGNTSTAKRTLTFDDRNPSLAVTYPAQDVMTNQTNMTIKGETSDITAVTVTVTMDGNTYTPTVTSGQFQQPVTFTTEKLYQIYVTAVNEVGNETVVQRNVVYDITPPAVTLDPVTSPTNLNSQVLTGTMEAGATVSVACPTATVGAITYPTATTWTVTLSTMQEGGNSVTVTATDEAGNISMPVSAIITVDLTPPAVSVSSPAPGGIYGTSVGIGAVVTDAVSGVASVEYQIDSGGWTPLPLTDPATGAYAITWNPTITDQGGHTVSFRATDKAGNISQPIIINITIQIDNTPPVTTISIGAPLFVAADKTYVTGSTVFTLSATDDLSGVAKTEYAIDGGQLIPYAPFSLAAEGSHTIRYRSTDIAGNIEGDKTLSVIVDNTPPTGSITINNGASYTRTSAVNLFVSASDGMGSGAAKMCLSNTSSCTAWENLAGTRAWTLSSGDGSKTVYVWFQDNLGNSSASPSIASITLDTAAPLLTVSTLPDGSWTNNPLLSISGQATDNTGIQQLTINGAVVTVNSDGTFGYPLTLQNGPNTVSVTATDLAGNQATDTRTINLDTAAPSSTITSPSGGSVMAASLVINGTASDAGSGVRKVEISTDGGATWSTATGTTSWSFNWTVPADGLYTIKSRATDNAGNVETPRAGITVNVYKRQPTSVSISGGQLLVNGNPFTIKGVVYSPVPIGADPEMMPPYGDYFTSGYNSIYDRDLPLLREMGANAVRLWSWDGQADHLAFLDAAYNNGANPIYVIASYPINPGLDIDPNSPNNVREQLKAGFREMVTLHKDHPAILIWAIGSDLNADSMYGAHPGNLFSLINEMAAEAHQEEDSSYHPVTTALSDSNLIATVSAYDASVPSLDIWGANIYRGNTFGTLFNDFKAVSSKPLVVLEYGIDAFDNVHGDEYENIGAPYQATYAESLWNEIKTNADVCIGGSITEYSDEWWKGKYSSTDTGCPDNNPALHSACGFSMSSSPDGYDNEEWWGIMRTRGNASGPDTMQTRVLYYTLQELWGGLTNTSHISVSPGTANFGSIALGGTPLTQMFTISNTGTENLAIGSIALSGTNASEFVKQQDHCSGRTLVPSNTCTLQIAFSPTMAGAKNATLAIPSDDANTPTLYVALSGAATVSISGTVTSGQGGLAGVTITLSGTASATATTDASGYYIFSGLAGGSYTVTPSMTGYVFTPTSRSLNISGNETGQNFTGTLATFTITPSAGSGGSVSPSTPQTVNYSGTIAFTITPNAGYHIVDVAVDGVSKGAISSYAFTNVVANHTISASFGTTSSTLDFGVFGATGVTMSGGGYVDSYDSTRGPYSGAHGTNGPVGTNSTSRGAITMSGGAIVYGNAWVGPGGNPATAITMSGGAVIYGTKAALPSAKDMTPRTDRGGGTSTTFTNGTTLTSGTYRVSSINLSGNGIGTINGNVTLYVTGSIAVSGSAKIVILPGGSLTVYVNGSMNVSGGGIVNQTLNPHALTIYGTSTCTSANYSGSSALYGSIYAPRASIALSGGCGIYGSVIGGSVTMSGGATVHYDESLKN